MASRLIREGILHSERIDQLEAPAEVFYRRLMSKVDDYGLFDARPSILRASLYPLRVDRVREAEISRWLVACQTAGVIALYTHESKPYLQMLDTRWKARSEPKYPIPPWGLDGGPLSTENSCEQPSTPVPVFVFGDGVGDDKEKGARKRAQPFDPLGIELPPWLALDVWQMWVEDRKARKKPVSERGAAMQLQKLDEYRAQGFTAKQVIEHSIAGGYQGLFAPAKSQLQTGANSGDLPWFETRSGIEGKGVELGIGKWNEATQWPTYRARVFAAAGHEEHA